MFVAPPRRYRYEEIIGETKRAWLVRVAGRREPVRLPKSNIEFGVHEGRPVVWAETRVAEFCGLIEEVHL